MPINKNEITKEQIEKAMQCKTAAEKSTAVRKTVIFHTKKTAVDVEAPRLLNSVLC